jgi:hypothetical protein
VTHPLTFTGEVTADDESLRIGETDVLDTLAGTENTGFGCFVGVVRIHSDAGTDEYSGAVSVETFQPDWSDVTPGSPAGFFVSEENILDIMRRMNGKHVTLEIVPSAKEEKP